MTVQTTLQLGSETSSVLCTEDGQEVLEQELPLGTASLARQWMRHTPPTPLDIEHAIEQTEDVVMPLAATLARTEQLQLSGSGAALILQGVGAAPDAALHWMKPPRFPEPVRSRGWGIVSHGTRPEG